MAGLYIHIPFCRRACHYCDFHFSTQLKSKSELTRALIDELELRKHEWRDQTINTVYLGGGTPSLLTYDELASLMDQVQTVTDLSGDVEITLEANPDDLTSEKLGNIIELGINRLSIGVQTFHDPLLQFLNRSHTAADIYEVFELAGQYDLRNISADLIFGIPGMTMEIWRNDLEKLIEINPTHISVYGLTIEPTTVFGRWMSKGKLNEMEDSVQEKQFKLAHKLLAAAGYDHYEISNYAKPGFMSRHNSSYWLQHPYYGIGPSAHSYDGHTRKMNVANNRRYIESIANKSIPAKIEKLSRTQQLNEYLLTRIRTRFGLDLDYLKQTFAIDLAADRSKDLKFLTEQGLVKHQNDLITITDRGMLVADTITEKLFYME